MDSIQSLCRLKTNVVRDLIHAQDLKLWWVAEFSGIHKTTLRRWLSGRTRQMRSSNVMRLASLLDTELSFIVNPR